MPYKRIAAALCLVLAAAYVRFFVPELYEEARPAFMQALGEDRIALHLPEAVSVWLDWD